MKINQTIELEIKDQKFSLTKEEAENLYGLLKTALNKVDYQPYPTPIYDHWTFPSPAHPYNGTPPDYYYTTNTNKQ